MLSSLTAHLCVLLLVLVAVVSNAVQASTAPLSATLTPEILNFTQKLDHSAKDSQETFQQSYQIVTDYFREGGPILFVQSAESPLVLLQYNVFIDWAEELGAIVATLEHRFFGTSYPEDFHFANPGPDDYAQLTLDNAIKDGVHFVNWIRETVPGAQDSKVIYNGGSYGGFLAAEAIIREPDAFYGSIASSPLLYSFGGQTLEGNPHHYAGLDMVSNIWFDESAEAAYKIQEATSLFSRCVAEQNCSDALPDLPLCSEANATQWTQLYGKVTSSYYSISQFNYAFVNVWPWAYPLQTAINLTLAASSPGEVLAVPLRGVSWAQDGCIDPNNRNLTGQPTFFGDSFQWIRCTYFPGSFGDSRPGSLLPSSNTTVGGDCWSPYAVPWQAPDFNETNEYFVEKLNLTLETLDQTERLLIVQVDYYARSSPYRGFDVICDYT
ncbi:Lysosomal Pro-X carboxypeptidase [Cyphellophora attinorum]|uniref:Lysosomal Pro-X carboxypeptidase n=1 Tax=Cyphellophora attinorum TaxID=1664694 RepID=A0A0N0NHS6_9EURO|nr:Lysosomal Pro-X carboxypeptidase [Phialophora attinorum]KPI34908.1 Lysosomal Pro-X carboxypeptidase [Phialophora attinorum]